MAEQASNSADAAVAKAAGASGGKKVLFVWLGALVVAIGLGSAAGFMTQKMLADKTPGETSTQPAQKAAPAEGKGDEEYVYIEFEPVVVALDVPNMVRYVRAIITLAVTQADQKAAAAMVEKKKPEIKNWLNLKMAGCRMEDVRGERSLQTLQREILDSLNSQLWPNSKPLIHHVLFKDIVVQ